MYQKEIEQKNQRIHQYQKRVISLQFKGEDNNFDTRENDIEDNDSFDDYHVKLENGIQALQEELDLKQTKLIERLEEINQLRKEISIYHATLQEVGGF